MKTTKKILSIVLAVMLLVGTVVVGVSAESMVYEKAGSKLTYTATVAGKEANADGYIEVKPGETITVSVYAQANYYFSTTGSEIFCWTAGFFNSFAASDVTTHNFVNNYTPNKKVIASTAANQLGNGYNKGTHEGYVHGRTYSTDCTSPYDASTATLGYTFTFTVPETATIGATGEFLMPGTCSATTATSSRYIAIYAAVNNSDTNYNSGTVASIYPETIDLTGTVLNFKVVSEEVALDYTELNAQIGSFDAADNTIYTEASWAVASDAYNLANAIKEDPNATQDDIDAAATALKDALAKLVPLGNCNYADLDAAIADYEAKLTEKDLYTNWAGYEAAYNAAKAVERDMLDDEDGVNQTTIDDATEALVNYVLTYKAADYSAVNAAKNLAAALDPNAYTSASLKAVTDAVAAVVEGYNITKQAEVDAMAKAINDAIGKLVPLGNCNYVALDAAIAAYDAKLAEKDLYTNWAGYEAAYNAAKAVERDMIADEDGVNQTIIDDATEALVNYVLEYKAADYTAVDAAKAAAAAVDASKYTSASVKAVDNAVNAVVYGLNITKQAEVDAYAAAINDAIAKLVPLAPCDYTALDAAIALVPEYTAEYYDAAEYAAYEAALAAAKAVERGMLADEAGVNQAKIDNATAALVAAYNELDARFVDRSALEAALALTPAYGAEYYDAAAYLAWQDAVAAGTDSYEALDGEPDVDWAREEVAAAVKAINNAFDALIPEFIDYSALEEAVELYGKTPEASDAYTQETYDPYAAALERAKAILAEKNPEAPASDANLAGTIAAAAKELEATFNALEIAPVEPPVEPEVPALTIVTAVRVMEDFYQVGDTVNFEFDCAITNVTKVQVVFANGSTLTYHRAHSSVVSIVDNGNGTETWTIAIRIYYAEADATARGKLGSVWEDEGCAFKYETKAKPVAEDYAVKSAVVLLNDAVVTEFTANDTVVLKIVCGPDTLRIRLVNQKDGGTSTFDRSRATPDENGNWVWLITYKYSVGTYAFDIHTAGSSNRLADANEDLVFTAKAYAPYVGPSTGDEADIVVSAAVAKARLVRDDVQTFTIVTDKNAWGVRVLDENGSVLTYSKDASTATDNGDGTLTWTLTTTCNVAGTFNCKVDAIYGSSWMNNGTTVTYKVVY